MRWNLQVRASAAAAPPSAAGPAPSQASAPAGRVQRAGSQPGSRLAAPAGPARRDRGLLRRPVQALAAGTAERAPGRRGEPAGAENGGGLEELNGAGTPGGGPSRGARRRRPAGACVLGGGFPARLGRVRCRGGPSGPGAVGSEGGGRPKPTRVPWAWSTCRPLAGCRVRLCSAKGVEAAWPDLVFKDRAGRGLRCGDSPSPAN